MAQRIKVLLLIPHLGCGGAQRVTALLARGLSLEKYEVHLGLITQASTPPDSIPRSVILHTLGARRVRAAAVPLLLLVRHLKPDVILSVMAHLNFLVLLLRPFFPARTAALVRQNGTVSSALAAGDLPAYTRVAFRWLYPRADRVICQTQAMSADLMRVTGLPTQRLVVLPNPVDVDRIRTTIATADSTSNLWSGPGPRLLAVGRLSPVKGFDLLLQALAAVRVHFPTANLLIAGAGPEQATLEALSAQLNLQESVRFAGHVDHPSTLFVGASLFVLSSRHEGLPNALLEAAAGGLPIVASPASQGLEDLLRDQPGVWLVPEITAKALASTLLTALAALQPLRRFPHLFVEQFALNRSIEKYEQLIDTAIEERHL